MIPTEPTGTGEALRLSRSSLTVFPLTHSVASELEAMAEPQPNVLKRASTILPFSSTSTCGREHFGDTFSARFSSANSAGERDWPCPGLRA